jgi:hypothetical protein
MLAVVAFSTLLLFSLLGMVAIAYADGPLSGTGYLDFSYGTTVQGDPTEDKPESKLWWNDGFWWGSLYNDAAGEYRIYRLDWGTQTWEDTGVAIDDREDSRADVLWDEANNKLYVVSHFADENSSRTGNPANRGRLYRYSYDEATQSYSLDSDFSPPPNVNEDKTEALVLAKDSNGRLWVTYVSRPGGTTDYQVYVNASAGGSLSGDANWGTPFTPTLATTPTAVHVAKDDISSVVAFKDDVGDDKIGIMWSNQDTGTLHFAYRDDGAALGAPWTHQAVPAPGGPDDHINMKSLKAGPSGVFAAVKTGATTPTDPLIGLVARDPDGTLSFHEYSTRADNDTRPLLLIDEDDDKAYIFVVGKSGGNMICYKSLTISSPPSNTGDFPAGNCGPGGAGEPTEFIDDEAAGLYKKINNPTSTKQNVNSTTGLVVLAADDFNGQVYVHNVLGDPPPVVTARGPERDETDVQVSAVVTATFSKPMNASTLNSGNFTVEDGSGSVSGNISYDGPSRTATFTPDDLLKADTTHTVKLNNNIKDTSGNRLFGTGTVREEWSFTTGSTTVQFSDPSYSVNESDSTASITVTLNNSSAISVAVDVNYATSDDTATEGIDYESTSGTLTFDPGGVTSQSFSVTILQDTDVEGGETITLTLSEPVNAHLDTPSTATLTIVDDDVDDDYRLYLPILLRNHTD